MLRARPLGLDRLWTASRLMTAVLVALTVGSSVTVTLRIDGSPEPTTTGPARDVAAPLVPFKIGEITVGRSLIDAAAPAPARVRVPSIGVDAAVVALDVDAAGELQTPADYATTGWWRAGPEPGERGPAVIAGHVDSAVGPAVFYPLADLRPGAEVLVDRASAPVATFRVDRVERHAKDAFPTDAVYGDTDDAQLRLVTCGGAFDSSTGHYLDNVIVFATRTS